MKAKEYIVKLQEAEGEQKTEVLKNFFEEVATLDKNRTSGSKPETEGAARDGVIRESKQKFAVICNKISWLKPEMFDELLAQFSNEVLVKHKVYLEKKAQPVVPDATEVRKGVGKKDNEKLKEIKSIFGRKLVEA